MKKLHGLFMLLFCINAFSQSSKTLSETLYEDGLGYLRGITKYHNPKLAKSLFYQSAKLGCPQAMNELGNIYSDGMYFRRNIDSAIFWYKKAIFSEYAPSCYNIANLYRLGFNIPQDFTEAFRYYMKGMEMKNSDCKKAIAYMYYKGLGTSQNYYKAFDLYKEIAETGNVNAMYFLGLCYRNGYGTFPDPELSKLWLQKSASQFEKQASNELKEEMPENVSTITQNTQNDVEIIKNNVEKFKPANSNNYEGTYRGYAVYYDWSGKHVIEILPLTIQLEKNKNTYSGSWKEGNTEETKIRMLSTGNNFKFRQGCSYTRVNHYSGRQPETWFFNEATLNLSFQNDSIVLSGFVHFYSEARREPGKPLQIILKKAFDKSDINAGLISFSIFPNPSNGDTKIQFTLSNTSQIRLRVYSLNGVLVYTNSEKKLPAGTYTYDLPINNFFPGSYYVQVLIDGKISSTKKLIKQ